MSDVTVNVDTTVQQVDINATTTVQNVAVTAATTVQEVSVTVTEGGGGSEVEIINSDNTYSATATPPTFVLPDTDYDIYVNGVFQASTSLPTLAP